jgi:alpha-tubulin suppressor-like RCC1 family protein
MNSRDLCRELVRNVSLLAAVLGLAACGATEPGSGEEVGEVAEALLTSCPAGYPNNGGIVIVGTAASETLNGTSGGDCILGHGGNDIINGLGGHDYLIGGAGDDTLNGGIGNDVIVPETGNDTVFGGPDPDVVNSLVNSGGNDIIHGEDGADQLFGGNGNDQIFGEAGNDQIKGFPGDDLIDGGDGNDNIEGTSGADTITGGIGDDKVYGNDGDDTLNGGVGNDFLFGGNGSDVLNGEAGIDTLRGEVGIDNINGGADNDLIYGGSEGDVIHGDAGNDVAYGEDGADQLFGDDGDDRLAGGAGVDTLQGGLGNDLFDEGGDGGSVVGDAGNDAAIQAGSVNGSVGTDACTGQSCELTEPTPNCPGGCGVGRRCAREVSFCIACQSNSECPFGTECVPTLGCRARESDCSNGADDDADGAIDCQDTDCADSPACSPNGFGGGAGNWHGCVTSSAGGVSCWGRNNLCQLGFQSAGGSVPGAVAGITTAADVRLGSYNSCTLLDAGNVQCWGSSTTGVLGDNHVFTGDCTQTPQDVVGLAGASQLSVGAGHACAVVGGGIQCWGTNGHGQLGANSATVVHYAPVSVVGMTTAVQVSAGSQNTCAVLSNGTVQCWGRNHRGQLGIGVTGNPSSVPVAVTGLTNVAQVAVGQDFACARTFAGTVSCWGNNAFGELGNGTLGGTSTVPVTAGISSVISIQAGASHMCAIPQGGIVSCWGLNTDGQIGIGTTSAGEATPVATAPAVSAVALERGRAFSCGKSLTGVVSCWGDNLYGQIAADAPADHSTAFVKTGLPP